MEVHIWKVNHTETSDIGRTNELHVTKNEGYFVTNSIDLNEIITKMKRSYQNIKIDHAIYLGEAINLTDVDVD